MKDKFPDNPVKYTLPKLIPIFKNVCLRNTCMYRNEHWDKHAVYNTT